MDREGYVKVPGGNVWYRMVGSEGAVPLLLLHGGPGFTHIGFEPLLPLSEDRPIIFYDQLGAGNSDRPNDNSLWRIDRFVDELAELRSALGLEEVHILGHSWGTMLLMDYLLTNPVGVKSVIFSGPCLSAPRWAADQEVYRRQLPENVQEVLDRCEREGLTGTKEYQEAVEVYYRRHVCRLNPWPERMKRGMEAANMNVYNMMWGPAEFTATGNLKDYDRTADLHKLHSPTLFICGRYDEATPATTAYYQSLVPGSELVVLENSSHSTMSEETEKYIATVHQFLSRVERLDS